MPDPTPPGNQASPPSAGASGAPSPVQGAPTEVAPPPADGVTITLDGRQVVAKKGELLISVAERVGTYIPRFCYHPRMKPVGMCRMCLVDIKGPRGFSLSPACYLNVVEGMEAVTDSPAVKKAQDGILEFLLVNHPLDCPVCDKGGECPLQDQTLAYGPGETRFVEEKRHWDKPIPLSALVLLDRERCIQCARCTRFADEVAGDAGIDFASRSDSTEVADLPDGAVCLQFQRQRRPDLPCRCPLGQALPVQGQAMGPSASGNNVQLLRRGVPRRGPVQLGPGGPFPGRGQRPRQLELAVRQRPLLASKLSTAPSGWHSPWSGARPDQAPTGPAPVRARWPRAVGPRRSQRSSPALTG